MSGAKLGLTPWENEPAIQRQDRKQASLPDWQATQTRETVAPVSAGTRFFAPGKAPRPELAKPMRNLTGYRPRVFLPVSAS